MTKLLRFLKLWPFHKMDMGRIDKLNLWAELATADIHWHKFITEWSIQMAQDLHDEIMADVEKSAQLDYIR